MQFLDKKFSSWMECYKSLQISLLLFMIRNLRKQITHSFSHYHVFYAIMIQFLSTMTFTAISPDWTYLNATSVGWFEGENRCWGKALLILLSMGTSSSVCESVSLSDTCSWQIKLFPSWSLLSPAPRWRPHFVLKNLKHATISIVKNI